MVRVMVMVRVRVRVRVTGGFSGGYKGSNSICSSKLFVFTASDHACFDISDALRYILGL